MADTRLNVYIYFRQYQVKVIKVKIRYWLYRFLHETDSRPEVLYSLRSGS